MNKLILVGVCVALAACAPSGPLSDASQSVDSTNDATVPSQPSPALPDDAQPVTVDFVQDGDSLRVVINGSEERIRLIGINTPESGECYGDEARTTLVELLDGANDIYVSTDVEAYDQYGRILGYLWADGAFVNAELVASGAALARAYQPNTSYQDVLDAAESAAQTAAVGMWSPTACGPATDAALVIVDINADADGRDDENLNGEWAIVENQGTESVDLSGWTLKDESSVHRFTFPSGTTIEPDAALVVFTGCGQTNPPEFFWCDETPVWDNSGDTAFLLDANGTIVDQFSY